MTKYNILVVDPPYNFKDSLSMSDVARGSSSNYRILHNNDLLSLPISDVCANDAILALWVPSALLPFGFSLLAKWEFEFKQTYVWIKTKNKPLDFFKKAVLACLKNSEVCYDEFAYKRLVRDIASGVDNINFNSKDTILSFGMGRLFRQTHEIALIGVRGNVYNRLRNRSQRSVAFAKTYKHSEKPEHLQNSLDVMFPDDMKRLEVFARRDRINWTCIGLECPSTLGEDVKDSLARLAKE
jgi:N6-adenosine-specific RNA methylase IME4